VRRANGSDPSLQGIDDLGPGLYVPPGSIRANDTTANLDDSIQNRSLKLLFGDPLVRELADGLRRVSARRAALDVPRAARRIGGVWFRAVRCRYIDCNWGVASVQLRRIICITPRSSSRS
jgi:hypothetical protein